MCQALFSGRGDIEVTKKPSWGLNFKGEKERENTQKNRSTISCQAMFRATKKTKAEEGGIEGGRG